MEQKVCKIITDIKNKILINKFTITKADRKDGSRTHNRIKR